MMKMTLCFDPFLYCDGKIQNAYPLSLCHCVCVSVRWKVKGKMKQKTVNKDTQKTEDENITDLCNQQTEGHNQDHPEEMMHSIKNVSTVFSWMNRQTCYE